MIEDQGEAARGLGPDNPGMGLRRDLNEFTWAIDVIGQPANQKVSLLLWPWKWPFEHLFDRMS